MSKCHEHGIQVYIHEASIEDINRDQDQQRKQITLSKANKYPKLKGIHCPDKNALVQRYGVIKKDNDHVDVRLLHAIEIKVAGFLVTEDIGLKERAEKCGLDDRVLNVIEALSWLRQTYEPLKIKLPHIQHLGCHQLDVNQPIFTSLKNDYNEFENWFKNNCIPNHRDCWTVTLDNTIVAIAIWKDETGSDLNGTIVEDNNPAENKDKVFKICTFKVDDAYRGSKIGEHLLKQALWHAYENKYDWIYLTTFPDKQPFLINFLKGFGFESCGKNNRSEEVLVKRVIHTDVPLNGLAPVAYHKKYYPVFLDNGGIQKFMIPIEPKFHLKLFPEYSPASQPLLFQPEQVTSIQNEVSGNTIRKVYLCRAQVKKMKQGDIALFYMSKNDNFLYSQSVTVVGVIDGYIECSSLEELQAATAKRSVYSYDDMRILLESSSSPIKVIDFMIAGHITGINDTPPPDLNRLTSNGILNGQPQSITEIDDSRYSKLKSMIQITRSANA
jgi:predicted GNAT family N-acyltransferase